MTEPAKSPSASSTEALSRAVAAWRKAQVVHHGPPWDGQPEASALVEEVALHPECESMLYDLLTDPNQLIVAYALITLAMMGSDRLAELPNALLQRRSGLTLQFGSIRSKIDLGAFASQFQKRTKIAAANPGPPC